MHMLFFLNGKMFLKKPRKLVFDLSLSNTIIRVWARIEYLFSCHLYCRRIRK